MSQSNFEIQIINAQHSIDRREGDDKEWLQVLLNILKRKRWARIVTKCGKELDVQRIANTSSWASFYDVINHIEMFDTSKFPVEIDELSILNTWRNLFH